MKTIDTHTYVDRKTLAAKRIMDIAMVVIGLVVTLPLFPLIALAIKLESPGSVFFRQQRIGRAYPNYVEIFSMIKFRTMVNDAEKYSGAVWAKKNDSRVTHVGRFLRKTRLDELPQLINVLKGEMSMIGPRPERPGFYGELERAIPYFAERTYGLLPGITGLAQINQGYDETIADVRSKAGYDHRYALALTSIKDCLVMDTSIGWKTIMIMLLGKGQ